MKSDNKNHLLDQFVVKWNKSIPYLIWGTSNTADYLLNMSGASIICDAFIDNDPQKWETEFHGKPVFSWEQCKRTFPNHKIIVASLAYPEIRAALREQGLKELEDFCDSRYFLSAHAVISENKLYLARTDLSVTEYCNLRCKNCNMLMPYFEHPKHRNLSLLKEDIDAYFSWVDQVQVFTLLGGEPFLYPNILELTQYLCENYGSRVHQVVFFSNGTLIPSDELLELMREYDIEVQVSDYRKGLPYLAEKVDRFQDTLRAHGIRFRHGVDEQWISFGFPDYQRPSNWKGDPIAFFDECYAPFRGLYQKKFYYCHLEASAEAAGLFTPSANDYFDLSHFDAKRKVELAEFDLGYTKTGDISYCTRCKGCFSVNQDYVPVAEQQGR
ncbi:radical SAM protein [Candidatus Agathobaculum pullicola]|uniref:radical SAM protein n=1 Tax=Candidatus Agathobaculum pullicola TaxID=2838426 RepID=UPI003F8F7C80